MTGKKKPVAKDESVSEAESSNAQLGSDGSFFRLRSIPLPWLFGSIGVLGCTTIGIIWLATRSTETHQTTVTDGAPNVSITETNQRDYSRISPLDLPRVRLEEANRLFANKKYELAIDAYSSARQDAFQVHDEALAALSIRQQAIAVFEAGRQQHNDRLQEAEALVGDAMEMHRRLKLDNEVLQDQRALAELYLRGDSISLDKLPVPSQLLPRNTALRVGYLQRHTQGDVDASLKTYQKIFDAIPAEEDPGAKADVLYRITERYLDKLQWDAAQRTLKDSIPLWKQMQAGEREGMSREALILRSEAQSAYGLALELSLEFDTALLALMSTRTGEVSHESSTSAQGKKAPQHKSLNELHAQFFSAENTKIRQLAEKSTMVETRARQLVRDTPAQIQREAITLQVLWPGLFAQLCLERMRGQNVLKLLQQVQELTSDPEATLLVNHARALYLLSHAEMSDAKQIASVSERDAPNVFRRIPLLSSKLSQLQELILL